MAAKKKDVEKLITVQTAVPVVIWRANRPLTEQQHEELARKLQIEQERTGLKVMLVPNSVETEIVVSVDEQQTVQTTDISQQESGTDEDESSPSSETQPNE